MKPLSFCHVFDGAGCDNGAKATQTNRVDCAVIIFLTMSVSTFNFHVVPPLGGGREGLESLGRG